MLSALAAFVAVLLACVVVVVVLLVVRPPFAAPLVEAVSGISGVLPAGQGADDAPAASASSDSQTFSNLGDTVPTQAQQEQEETLHRQAQQTPLVAQYGDVDIRCPIEPADLTGVLFHQASYNYALVMETQLPEANYEKALNERNTRINRKQTTGEWLDADALHIWRTTDVTPMDTSIDIGAAAGTAVRAPVTGTVVLVQKYKLYDEMDDIQIHVQPDGHPELDCVMLHTTDPKVEPGDHVEAGLTPFCAVRDIEKDLVDVQLGFYTPDGVGGNHVHVQINDADFPGYRKEKLKGAYKVKS